jgi:hypothetical protein
MSLCQAKGYRLITIFSDEWQFKKDIVKQKILNILGKTESSIGARKCSVKTIPGQTARKFFDSNHIQGWAPGAEVHLALEYNQNVVAVMSFSKPRGLTNNKQEAGTWELLRYATNAHVVGGASRLLTAFEKVYQPQKVFSFADARWSVGNLYLALGFSLEGQSDAGYWYTRDYLTREHRIRYTKQSLIKQGFDLSLTEWEIQQNRGYDRIWDCGQLKFVKTYQY